jgi:hypothetical protein
MKTNEKGYVVTKKIDNNELKEFVEKCEHNNRIIQTSKRTENGIILPLVVHKQTDIIDNDIYPKFFIGPSIN